MKLLPLLLLALVALASNSNAISDATMSKPNAGGPAPDTIFINADIYTQAQPARAQAMAVREGRILAVGSNDEIRKLKEKHTQVIDLGGHFVMPGFNDAHVHLASGGFYSYKSTSWACSRWPRCSSASQPASRRLHRASGS